MANLYKITDEIASEIGNYLKNLLTFPSENWSHIEFEDNVFWNESRIKAKEFVKKLKIENRAYWK